MSAFPQPWELTSHAGVKQEFCAVLQGQRSHTGQRTLRFTGYSVRVWCVQWTVYELQVRYFEVREAAFI